MEHAIGSLAFEVPLRVNFGIDWRVLSVTLAVAGIAGIISGLAPAMYARRADLNTLFKTGGRTSAGAERGRLRGLLIVAQIAVSLVLLIVGGLFVKALARARNVDLGFRSDHVLLADVDLPQRSYTPAKRAAYYREAHHRIAALPGVRTAAWISAPPFSFGMDQTALQPDGEPAPPPGQEPSRSP